MTPDRSLLEDPIRRIPDVREARIVTDRDGEIVEIHVLASLGKHPKQLVRDVQSVLMAAAGVEIDHRVVSVVQLREDEGEDEAGGIVADAESAPREVRLALDGLLVGRRAGSVEAMVEIRHEDGLFSASCGADVDVASVPRIVAQATLDAVSKALPVSRVIVLEGVRVVDVGEHRTVVTTLRLAGVVVAGAAVVRAAGVEDAAARAVLDALNRRLSRAHAA